MLVCSSCAHENVGTSSFCEDCGEKLVNPAKAEREADEIEASFMLDQVKKAKNALYLVAGVQIVGGVLTVMFMPAGDQGAVLVAVVVIGLLFVGLGVWSRKNPFAAALVGLFLFVGMHLLEAIEDPSALYRGILLKIFVISILARAVKAGFDYRSFVRSKGIA